MTKATSNRTPCKHNRTLRGIKKDLIINKERYPRDVGFWIDICKDCKNYRYRQNNGKKIGIDRHINDIWNSRILAGNINSKIRDVIQEVMNCNQVIPMNAKNTAYLNKFYCKKSPQK